VTSLANQVLRQQRNPGCDPITQPQTKRITYCLKHINAKINTTQILHDCLSKGGKPPSCSTWNADAWITL